MPNELGIAKIKVIGVGGGGNNAVNRMIKANVTSAEFIAANTDLQVLNLSLAPTIIQLGTMITKGLGAGSEPEVGARSAQESKEQIKSVLEDTDLLFITAGMGGGTGTGAAPVIAELAKEMGILTIAVVTKPFEKFEGRVRMNNALIGIEKLRQNVDTLIVIPNEKIMNYAPKGTSMQKAFDIIDDVLRQGIQGLSDLIITPSTINLDFADIKNVMKNSGNAHIGIGRGKGENKMFDAVRQAVSSPLLDTKIIGATSIIVNVVGDPELPLDAVDSAISLVAEAVDKNCNIIFGAGTDKSLKDEVVITIIATGFDANSQAMYIKNYNPSTIKSDGLDTQKPYNNIFDTPSNIDVPKKEEPIAKVMQEPFQEEIDISVSSPQKKNLPPFLLKLQENFKKR